MVFSAPRVNQPLGYAGLLGDFNNLLCCLPLQKETSFLYYLSEVYSLQMSPYIGKYWQSGRNSEPFIN